MYDFISLCLNCSGSKDVSTFSIVCVENQITKAYNLSFFLHRSSVY